MRASDNPQSRPSRARAGIAWALLLVLGVAPAAAEEQRPQSYVQLAFAQVVFDGSLSVRPEGDPDAEAIDYRRAIGGHLRASWQSAAGGFLYFDYLGTDACVGDCLGGGDAEDTRAALEHYAFGLGWHRSDVVAGTDVYATAARERRNVEKCEEDDDDACREDRRAGATVGLGVQRPLSERWSVGAHYAYYLGMDDPDDPEERLLRIGNGRLTLSARVELVEGLFDGVFEYEESRNRGGRVGVRLRF
ncbi:outer membrane beta-barrel protein [Halorhodospira sp. 9622]|uniref:outer membrane beta-barrel protein n=1 Tax=Halorhodospira sp. 9622 TaxID=2899136 RepID=UPI001EE81856|nr:outer membrane beta-barrel protein [Halorhodospira sp. 9622]MCG5538252.1 porin family protein [Halorhodospira sp. 9622]